MRLPQPKDIAKDSLNPDPLTHWSGPENIAWVRINDENSWAILDNDSTINTVTPDFIEACSLVVGPLNNLVNGTLSINGFGGLFSQPFGYIIIRVQVEGVQGYDESIKSNHQSNHKLDQREQNRWVVSFIEWVENIPLVGMSSSRTLHWEWDGCKPSHGSDQLEWGCQSDNKRRNRWFFCQRSYMLKLRLYF